MREILLIYYIKFTVLNIFVISINNIYFELIISEVHLIKSKDLLSQFLFGIKPNYLRLCPEKRQKISGGKRLHLIN